VHLFQSFIDAEQENHNALGQRNFYRDLRGCFDQRKTERFLPFYVHFLMYSLGPFPQGAFPVWACTPAREFAFKNTDLRKLARSAHCASDGRTVNQTRARDALESDTMAACEISYPAYWPAQKFVIETQAELKPELLHDRCKHLNVILRLAMLTGLQMQIDSTLNLLCDMAAEIVSFDRATIWFSSESGEEARQRIVRGQEVPQDGEAAPDMNVFQVWAAQYSRPLIVRHERSPEADAVLRPFHSALVVPLFVDSQVAGSMQMFSLKEKHFTEEDAQLLWVFSLVAENLLSRGSAHEGLLRFAFTDYLTGLRSRRFFEQQLDLELKRAQRHQQQFALLMIDIDHFKRLNDTFGHHIGDQALRGVAYLLMQEMREADTSARYGGEEFAIILPETSEQGARQVSERLRRTIEQTGFFAGPDVAPQHITISIGFAIYGVDAVLKNDLAAFADSALYAAKREGRNRVVCYSELAAAELK
jgi:diguanylate cyclase (GGDEF)-like protein